MLGRAGIGLGVMLVGATSILVIQALSRSIQGLTLVDFKV